MTAIGLGLVLGALIGAVGGGGGVLAVPMLVYLLGQSVHDATTGSLVIVGVAALAGALARVGDGLVRWRIAAAFAVTGAPAAFLGTVVNRYVPGPVLLLGFAGLMLISATAMLVRPPETCERDQQVRLDWQHGVRPSPASTLLGLGTRTRRAVRQSPAGVAVMVLATAVAIGFLTGLLGVGGGFLVVPALVVGLRLPMPVAIATSLVLITVNAVASLAARAGHLEVDWVLIVPFTAAAIVGSLLGRRIAGRFSGVALTRVFAVLLLTVAGVVVAQNLLAAASLTAAPAGPSATPRPSWDR